MAALKGTWRFNDEIELSEMSAWGSPIYISFECTGVSYTSLIVDNMDTWFMSYIDSNNRAKGVYYSTDGGWISETYKTITFSSEQEVSDEFYDWFTANAVEVVTIKAGTYRFNDVLSAPTATYNQGIQFTINRYIPNTTDKVLINGSHIQVDVGSTDGGLDYLRGMWYDLDSSNIDLGFNLPDRLTVYHEDYNGWNPYYADLFQTITLPNDSEVSTEFAEWFSANAAPVVEHTVSGVWKFKGVLTAPSGNLEQGVSFSVADGDYEITQEMADQFAQYYGITVSVGSFTASGSFAGIKTNDVNAYGYLVVDYTGGVFRAGDDRYNAVVQLVLNDGDKEVYNSTDGMYWTVGSVPNPQTINFGTEPQIVSAEFYSWLTANATQPMASVSHNGEEIASLFPGQTATLKCAGMKMAGDVVVSVAKGIIGGECSGNHIIEVTELPTENIDENVLYLCNGIYHKRANEIKDVILVSGEEPVSCLQLFPMMGVTATVNTIPTKKKTDDSILSSDIENCIHAYYIEDENDIFIYATELDGQGINDFVSLAVLLDGQPYSGIIYDISEAVIDSSYYALMETVWREYYYATGTMSIVENGTYKVIGNKNVKVSVPAMVLVETIADLPTDASDGSIAFVMEGE